MHINLKNPLLPFSSRTECKSCDFPKKECSQKKNQKFSSLCVEKCKHNKM